MKRGYEKDAIANSDADLNQQEYFAGEIFGTCRMLNNVLPHIVKFSACAESEMKSPPTAAAISHAAGVFHARRAFHKSRKGFISLKKARRSVLFSGAGKRT